MSYILDQNQMELTQQNQSCQQRTWVGTLVIFSPAPTPSLGAHLDWTMGTEATEGVEWGGGRWGSGKEVTSRECQQGRQALGPELCPME